MFVAGIALAKVNSKLHAGVNPAAQPRNPRDRALDRPVVGQRKAARSTDDFVTDIPIIASSPATRTPGRAATAIADRARRHSR